MIVLIDNFDSFTHNLARYFRELGEDVSVFRNNELTLTDIEQLAPQALVISPGPCTPNESGISLAAIEHFQTKLPILGVCLGHQALAQVFGANVVRAEKVMHGKTSVIKHSGEGLFRQLNNPLEVTRYHSLVVSPESLSTDFVIDADTETEKGQREIMAIRHRHLPLFGVQFHPESVMTAQGHNLLANFLRYIR
ncbi:MULTISPECIES: anthranilate synthase component II [Idiomarina]|jgi:para-aminobenzoate synthetase component 2|uniref:anthranilate synthase component II n=1 Tax=Idiomarina TaxID=135575 RepID=UPI000C0E4C71|nr:MULTISPECIES: aminodeoxychorismate/anthranilate synthase component II [unclassified Idiomarina]MAA62095.1 aminodeoxychorismate/anthranilate synthase component II [Idiomarina sp.]MBL4855294.1 aminodeoxychorismate/anthranilate synthase component II [Idiomarina sp.]PHQ89880.1 MAG: aminodeoxychorismate/anthranilate synthase component II [Idiomarina sp.]|tara:strand:- start:21649 stop:22230 length:582 start_codon:yes stop_codon:yes gene_type:complete